MTSPSDLTFDITNVDDVSILSEVDSLTMASTKSTAKLTHGIITIFPEAAERRLLEPETYGFNTEHIQRWCGQFEICGETQKLHAHIFFHFKLKNRQRFDSLVRRVETVVGCHPNIKRGRKATKQCIQGGINYCLKTETRHGEPFIWRGTCSFDPKVWDERSTSGKKFDKKNKIDLTKEQVDWIESKPKHWSWEQIVHESEASKYMFASCAWGKSFQAGRLASALRREIKNVIILYGAGGTGKTTLARAWDAQEGEDEIERYYKRNHEDGHFWGGGRVSYKGQRIIHFEEFDGTEMFSNIKEWCDIGKTGPPVNIKNGGAFLNHETVIFTTNVHPAGWYRGIWDKDPKQFHPFWRRITKVLFFPAHRENGSLNIPDTENPPYFVDQSDEWKEMSGDYESCRQHAADYWPLPDKPESNFAPGFTA